MKNYAITLILVFVTVTNALAYLPLYSYTFDFAGMAGISSTAICKSSSGGTIMAGDGGYGGMITEIDSAGNQLWMKNYSRTFYRMIIPGGNSNFLLTGHASDSITFKQGVTFTKIDQTGNELWTKIYFDTLTSGGYSYGNCIYECIDHAFLIGGTDFSNGLLYKIDGSGNPLWSRKFSVNGNPSEINCVKENPDSTIMIAGIVYDFPSNSFFAKLDQSGNIIWSKTYSYSTLDETGIVSFENLNNGYIITGGFRSEAVIRTDTSGNPIWSRNFTSTENVTTGGGMYAPKSHLLPDSTYLVLAGSSGDAYGTLLVIHMDLDGNVLRKAEFYANPIDAYQNSDKSFVIMGHGPLNLVSPQLFSYPQIELTHCDSTLGDSLHTASLCIDNQITNLNIDTTLISSHSILSLSTVSTLSSLLVTQVVFNNSLIRNPGCVGYTGSINEHELYSLQIYPNPTTNQLSIASDQLNGLSHLIIHDITGRAVLEEDVQFVDGKFSREINFENGHYFVWVENDGKVFYGKLVFCK